MLYLHADQDSKKSFNYMVLCTLLFVPLFLVITSTLFIIHVRVKHTLYLEYCLPRAWPHADPQARLKIQAFNIFMSMEPGI